jgi:4-hydroxy-tetrahydrodipicolinate synthase
MSQYARDIKAIRENGKGVTILTCHDEYLLASMVQGVDGALVGFASFIPDKITALYDCVKAGDLKGAQEIQEWILPLKEAVYASGEPSGEAHARMKTAMFLSGRLKSDAVRRPIRKPEGVAYQKIESAVRGAGFSGSR